MPRKPAAFCYDDLPPEGERRQRIRIMSRAARIRRARGDVLPNGRLKRISYAESVGVVVKHDLQADRDREARAFVRALPGIVKGLRRAHDLLLEPPAPRPKRVRVPRDAAWWRRYRLLRLKPAGATPEVWAEIVDHFASSCVHCGAPACRAAHMTDGTPIPVCARCS